MGETPAVYRAWIFIYLFQGIFFFFFRAKKFISGYLFIINIFNFRAKGYWDYWEKLRASIAPEKALLPLHPLSITSYHQPHIPGSTPTLPIPQSRRQHLAALPYNSSHHASLSYNSRNQVMMSFSSSISNLYYNRGGIFWSPIFVLNKYILYVYMNISYMYV